MEAAADRIRAASAIRPAGLVQRRQPIDELEQGRKLQCQGGSEKGQRPPDVLLLIGLLAVGFGERPLDVPERRMLRR